jgi:hypothetical protein
MTEIAYYEAKPNVKIESIEGLLKAIKEFEKEVGCDDDRRLYFRGDGCWSHGLKPSVGRVNVYKHAGKQLRGFSKDQEHDLLHRFQRYAYIHERRCLSEWEALFVGRHHGLPVRLLDWTANPLVALYNAVQCEDKRTQDGALWVFKRVKNGHDFDVIEAIKKDKSPFDLKGVKIIYPVYVDQRMLAQSGCFTIQDNPQKGLEDYKAGVESDIEALRKWEVPKCKNKSALLEDLQRMSIDHRNLYPDLDGLAKGLWHLEVIKRGIASGEAGN